jgi:hypothetical protein
VQNSIAWRRFFDTPNAVACGLVLNEKGLGQDFFDDAMFLFDAGQSLFETLELVCELFVVETHAMQYRCIDVVNMHGVFDDVVTEVVGFAMDQSFFDAAARHPHAEISGMVVPAVVVFCKCSL